MNVFATKYVMFNATTELLSVRWLIQKLLNGICSDSIEIDYALRY